MHLEIFSSGSSPIHRVDERVKIAVFIPLAVYISQCGDILRLSVYLTAAVLACAVSRLNFRKIAERLFLLNIFLVFFWLIIPFSFPGEISRGADLALRVTLKANAIVLLTIALIGTVPLVKLAAALRFFGMPDKLASALYFGIKYISIMHRDFTRTKNAMKIRGFKFRTGLRTYRITGNILGILLFKSHIYSQKLYNAMLCRGFEGKFPAGAGNRLARADLLFGATSALVFILLLWIKQ